MDEWEFNFDPPPNLPPQPITGDDYFETTDFKAACELYEITQAEGKRRHHVLLAHQGDPNDPICVGCAKRPHELACYIQMIDDVPGYENMVKELCLRYVIHNEGTYNGLNGHFLCDDCYIKNGQPTSLNGWTCP